MSNIIRVSKETVSLQQLQDNLPDSCFKAVTDSLQNSYEQKQSPLDDSLYYEYFRSEPTKPLSKKEQEELFEHLGNAWVKNHYSTQELRSFLNSEPSNKRNRFDE